MMERATGQYERSGVIDDPLEVEVALGDLGLARDDLIQVAEEAKWARNSSTAWDPPGYSGWNQFAMATRAMRVLHIEDRPEGQEWRKDNSGGLSRTIDPTGRIAIVVSSGTLGTGDPDGWPRTQNPKGSESLHGLRVNRYQIELFEEDHHSVNFEPTLWLLLIRVCGDEVFSELSLPLSCDHTGRVDDWHTRIILARGPEEIGEASADDDYEVDVLPRAG